MPTALPNGVSSAVTSFFARRRFRPRLVPTSALVVFVAVTVSLGNWQRHRAAEKDVLAAQFAAASREPAVDLPARDEEALALKFRPVRATGQYDAARQIFIDNKVHGGKAGFDVVAPLKLVQSGRYVLVDRGWIAQGASRRELPSVPPPTETLTVTGRVNLPPLRYLELGGEHTAGPLWENLDVKRVGSAMSIDLLPIVVEQTEPVVPGDALVRDWPPPDLGSQQNISYMLQWYSFAALAVVLWLALNWRSREDRNGN
jgi:surfeit locus 1 family protein